MRTRAIYHTFLRWRVLTARLRLCLGLARRSKIRLDHQGGAVIAEPLPMSFQQVERED